MWSNQFAFFNGVCAIWLYAAVAKLQKLIFFYIIHAHGYVRRTLCGVLKARLFRPSHDEKIKNTDDVHIFHFDHVSEIEVFPRSAHRDFYPWTTVERATAQVITNFRHCIPFQFEEHRILRICTVANRIMDVRRRKKVCDCDSRYLVVPPAWLKYNAFVYRFVFLFLLNFIFFLL